MNRDGIVDAADVGYMFAEWNVASASSGDLLLSVLGRTELYTGREFDAEVWLQYNRARYYDPGVGRWISEDLIGFAAGDYNISEGASTMASLVRGSLVAITILCFVLSWPRADYASIDTFVDFPLIWMMGFYVYPAYAWRLAHFHGARMLVLPIAAFHLVLFVLIVVVLIRRPGSVKLFALIFLGSIGLNCVNWCLCAIFSV